MATNKRLIKSNDEAAGGASFNTVLYSGNGTSSNLITTEFTPDFVWIKARNVTDPHYLIDSVRSPGCFLNSNTTNPDDCNPLHAAIVAGGFDAKGNPNASGRDYVAWCWKAGGAAVTNTDGTITSQVSANTEAGFSIVTWTGNGSATNVGHGLQTTPAMIIVKSRDVVDDWFVYHKDLNGGVNTGQYFIFLNQTIPEAYNVSSVWNGLAPTSSIFNLGSSSNNNGGNVAYCFAEVAGFSKFGSYTGNGNGSYDPTGTVVAQTITTGFEPAFVMVKRTDATEEWVIVDNKRGGSSPGSQWLKLFPRKSDAEANSAYAGGYSSFVDFTSNGFTLGNDPSLQFNVSGGTYIYMAFANQF